MLDATVILDLPSDSAKNIGSFWNRLRARVSSIGSGDDTHELTIAGREAFRRLLWGLDKAAFNDIVCATTVQETLWLDEKGQQPDLERLIATVVATGALERGFDLLRVVASRRLDKLHCLVSIDVRNHVPAGEPEFSAKVSTRFTDLRVRPWEMPLQYRARVEEFMADEPALEQSLLRVEDVARQLVRGLERTMGARLTELSTVEARIVVPGPEQVARFDGLVFGDGLPPRQYSAKPGPTQTGAYDNPHVYHYFDPYHDLLCWLITRAIVDKGLWRRPDVKLVHPRGIVLATASDADSLARVEFDVPASAVTLGETGIATGLE